MLYLSDVQPAYCPKCGKPMEPRQHGWEAQDRFYNAKQPFLCECGARVARHAPLSCRWKYRQRD